MADQLLTKALRLGKARERLLQRHEEARKVLADQAVRQTEQIASSGQTHAVRHSRGGQFSSAGGAYVQKRKGIAHPAFGQPGDKAGGFLGQGNLLLRGHPKQMPRDFPGIDALKIKALTSGDDSRQHFMDFGGSQNKNQMLGRSSIILRRALKALVDSIWTSSMMYTRYRAMPGEKPEPSRSSRMLSTPCW